jgi:protein ImuB
VPDFSSPQPLTPTPCLYAALYAPPRGDGLQIIAEAFSPRYELHGDDLVSIDVSGLERLFNVKEGLPARTIAEELRRAAQSRGVRVHVAVAGTWTAAVVLALAQPGVTIVERGEEAAALADVPIGTLEKIHDICTQSPQSPQKMEETKASADSAFSAFTRWGLTALGELASLPDADLAARLGPSARTWQAIARGEDLRPLVPALAEERFDASIELEWPIDSLEPLSFVLTRLLEPLSTRLERRDRGAAVLHVLLDLVTRERHARRLELPAPMRDVRTLRTLALLDLEAHPPPAAIDRVTIVIDPTPGRVLQHTLFTRAHPTPEQLSTLLARLGALMGQDRFGAPAVVDSYRPGAFAMAGFATEHDNQRRTRGTRRENTGGDSASSAGSAMNVVSALRRCRYPVPARVALASDRPVRVTTDRRGFAGGAVVRAVGPWRGSGNWWAGGAGQAGRAGEAGRETSDNPSSPILPIQPFPPIQPWDRDEWDVSLNDGAVYRIFRDRQTDAWFIDAIVD